MRPTLAAGSDEWLLAICVSRVGAYMVTASTSFANPAVTMARAATDTFAAVRPAAAPAVIDARLAGAGFATALLRWLTPLRP